jgi:WS/DGAT/MGAT family acyltransferase
MDRLNSLDVQFVDAEDEDRHTSMAVASISLFEGPPPSYDELLAHFSGRLPRLPRRYRQKLRTIPLRLGRPVWVDATDFDLRYHLRRTALPAPGTDEQLSQLMARVMSQRLDRDYPLWEYWLVEGLASDRWVLVYRVHHCMADGVSGTDLYRVLLDTSPEPAPPVPDDWTAGAEPSRLWLATQAALDMALIPGREAAALGGVLAHPGHAFRQAADVARGAAQLASSMRLATGSSLSGPIGQQRRYLWARASLDDVKTIRQGLGGTINDVFLTAISGGYRALLLARGEQPQPHMVPSLVPVSVRAPGEKSIYDNRVSAMLPYLPIHIADPVQRLTAIRADLSNLKASKEATAGEAIVSLGRYTPFPLMSRGMRLVYSLPQREIVTVTTNVPGPRQPLYAVGRRLLELIPFTPIATTVRTGVAVYTYCDKVAFGITGDYTANPDLQVLASGLQDSLAELLRAAERHARGM